MDVGELQKDGANAKGLRARVLRRQRIAHSRKLESLGYPVGGLEHSGAALDIKSRTFIVWNDEHANLVVTACKQSPGPLPSIQQNRAFVAVPHQGRFLDHPRRQEFGLFANFIILDVFAGGVDRRSIEEHLAAIDQPDVDAHRQSADGQDNSARGQPDFVFVRRQPPPQEFDQFAFHLALNSPNRFDIEGRSRPSIRQAG